LFAKREYVYHRNSAVLAQVEEEIRRTGLIPRDEEGADASEILCSGDGALPTLSVMVHDRVGGRGAGQASAHDVCAIERTRADD
jgi:hypothetical protein